MMAGGMNWGGGWSLFGMIPMFLFWALIIVAGIALVKWLASTTGDRASEPTDRARLILEERFARGEIGKDEFDQRKRDLGR